MKLPDFQFENDLWKKGLTVIGIDEVGRGAFAGPVGVGGVVFDANQSLKNKQYLLSIGINDSKKLTAKKRESLAAIIKQNCLMYHISFIDVSIINKIGIGKATFLGMDKVAKALFRKTKNPYLLIDGFEIPQVRNDQQKGIIRGDSLSISIAAASIIAKVARDKLMRELSVEYSNYGWDKNKGYGTLFHRRAISEVGLTDLHRVDFCKNCTVDL